MLVAGVRGDVLATAAAAEQHVSTGEQFGHILGPVTLSPFSAQQLTATKFCQQNVQINQIKCDFMYELSLIHI